MRHIPGYHRPRRRRWGRLNDLMLDIGLNELIDLLALVTDQDALAAGRPHPDARLPAISDTRHARPPSAAELLQAAAWLHDIGYLPEFAATGLHGLDGARYLRDVHRAEPLLCRLGAHHSCAVIEAE